MNLADARLNELAQRIRHDMDMLAYPSSPWVEPRADRDGGSVYNVVIVGAGQSGMAIAQGLIRDGVDKLLLIDRNPEGFEGPWMTYARMALLRTPKLQVGMDHGLPSLTTRAWYEAKYGPDSWATVDRVGREDWMEYLRWYRQVLKLPIRNDVTLTAIVPEDDWLALSLRTPQGAETVKARHVVLATGYDASGEWRSPPAIAASLPPDRCLHSNTVIDFARFRGKRLGILGHGASAFDAAVAAVKHGAMSVDLCFRRAVLPTVNPHRRIEFAGFLKHFPEADDAVRWSVACHFDAADQPPATHSYETAHRFPNFALHAASPWLTAALADDVIRVQTPHQTFLFDDVICATGSVPDLACRPELAPFVDRIALWRDRYVPPAAERHEQLGKYPYLGPHYEFLERDPGAAPFLRRLYAFNFSAIVSMGPHSTSISGHKYSVPRVIRGITRSLFLDQQQRLLPDIRAFQEREEIGKAVASLTRTLGQRPLGWYCRYSPGVNTRRLLVEEGGFLYDSNSYADDLPYWVDVGGKPHLVVPHTFSHNDNRFARGWISTAGEFFAYLKDAFDVLYREGEEHPKFMTVSLHNRLSGHPARSQGIERFLDYIAGIERVWICSRVDVAKHWHQHHRA